ncbi:MAG: type II toxin-antitoxin system RelE/ParE family toxin [Candidatus Pacearchaeota archaeon]|jgi:mRNA interferase RelE/StbE
MEYTLVFDKEFVKDFNKLDKSIRIEVEKKLKKLKENPREIGKPLRYFGNLYEFYVQMYRVFYVIEESRVKVLVLAIEHKDNTDKYLRQLSKEEISDRLSNISKNL